jgi:hypothetical protein
LDLSYERIFHFQVKMEIEHCMPCPSEPDAKAMLSKLTVLVTEFTNRRASTFVLDQITVSDKDMDTLDEITRAFRQIVRENRKLQDEVDKLKKQVKPKKEKPVKICCPFITAKGTQCRKFCVEGMKTCKVHSKPLKPPKPAKAPRAKKQCCTGINIRGNPCRNKCLEGKTHCERHDPDNPPVVKKTKRNKKRQQQMHNHTPDEIPKMRCLLCETHGDMFDPNIVNPVICETTGPSGYTLRSKLKSLYETTARVTGRD